MTDKNRTLIDIGLLTVVDDILGLADWFTVECKNVLRDVYGADENKIGGSLYEEVVGHLFVSMKKNRPTLTVGAFCASLVKRRATGLAEYGIRADNEIEINKEIISGNRGRER